MKINGLFIGLSLLLCSTSVLAQNNPLSRYSFSVDKVKNGEVWPLVPYKRGKVVYQIADVDDQSTIYESSVNKVNCFFVISKQEYRLYVYEVQHSDTALVAHFPICYAKYPECKTKSNDMRTPDCDMQHPFRISEIKDASKWTHDFKDGRGSFLAYGAWFMRLDLSASKCTPAVKSNRSIGIHGSTGNAESVPGRDSEGCIRLRDTDLITLKNLYARVGTKIVVKPYTQGKLPFEIAAEKKRGLNYRAQKRGNPLLKK